MYQLMSVPASEYQWMNVLVNECISEWTYQFINVSVNECMSEWMY